MLNTTNACFSPLAGHRANMAVGCGSAHHLPPQDGGRGTSISTHASTVTLLGEGAAPYPILSLKSLPRTDTYHPGAEEQSLLEASGNDALGAGVCSGGHSEHHRPAA